MLLCVNKKIAIYSIFSKKNVTAGNNDLFLAQRSYWTKRAFIDAFSPRFQALPLSVQSA